MTAHAVEEARIRCLEAGMDDFVAKPVTLNVLSQVLERSLAKKSGDLTGDLALNSRQV
jgi:CheY-like chemotaxis protein